MHRGFPRKISRKPEHIKSVCIDRIISFHSACRRWNLFYRNILLNQIFYKTLQKNSWPTFMSTFSSIRE